MTKIKKSSIFLSIGFFFLIKSHPIWAIIFPATVNTLIQVTGAIMAITLLILPIIALFKLPFNKNYKKAYFYIPIFIGPLILVEALYNPLRIDVDKIFGEVIYEACYEGTQNQAKIKLRKNGNFDIHWSGAFFYDEYFSGDYTEQNDTLTLNFKNDISPRNFGRLAIIVKGRGISFFDKENKPLRPIPYFYEGKCKGLN